MRRTARAALLALAAGLPLLASGCRQDQTALQRGDRLWADSAYEDALAEYRLGWARRHDGEALLRVAHTYATTGQLQRARETYQRLLATDSDAASQAVYDFIRLAARADSGGDRHGVATAVDAALTVNPMLDVEALAPTLGRYYADTGDPARAERFYQRALVSAPPDSQARYLYELGRLYQSHGDCGMAVAFLRPFEAGGFGGAAGEVEEAESLKDPGAQTDGTVRGEARWVLGSCAFELARQAHQDGRLGDALGRLDTVLGLGVPRNLQDQAWFERGEILFALGRSEEALAAYYRVLELNPAGEGQLVERARRRIDQIRFGT